MKSFSIENPHPISRTIQSPGNFHPRRRSSPPPPALRPLRYLRAFKFQESEPAILSLISRSRSVARRRAFMKSPPSIFHCFRYSSSLASFFCRAKYNGTSRPNELLPERANDVHARSPRSGKLFYSHANNSNYRVTAEGGGGGEGKICQSLRVAKLRLSAIV